MSRLAKNPITIPENVTVTVTDNTVTIKGPKGELARDFDMGVIAIAVKDGTVVLTPKNNEVFTRSLWGTYASHITNMIHGVTEGYEKKLILDGVGFRMETKGDALVCMLGFSHPVAFKVPAGLEVKVEKNEVTVVGIDKELVGAFTAKVRARKKPEPYKGKGFRYHDEVIRRKQGKKAV